MDTKQLIQRQNFSVYLTSHQIPISVRLNTNTQSYLTSLITTALERRGGTVDMPTLLQSVRMQALGKRIKAIDGKVAYALQDMLGDKVTFEDGRCTLIEMADI